MAAKDGDTQHKGSINEAHRAYGCLRLRLHYYYYHTQILTYKLTWIPSQKYMSNICPKIFPHCLVFHLGQAPPFHLYPVMCHVLWGSPSVHSCYFIHGRITMEITSLQAWKKSANSPNSQTNRKSMHNVRKVQWHRHHDARFLLYIYEDKEVEGIKLYVSQRAPSVKQLMASDAKSEKYLLFICRERGNVTIFSTAQCAP